VDIVERYRHPAPACLPACWEVGDILCLLELDDQTKHTHKNCWEVGDILILHRTPEGKYGVTLQVVAVHLTLNT
jgi:hypothetical protein